jgi:hypothetical protein
MDKAQHKDKTQISKICLQSFSHLKDKPVPIFWDRRYLPRKKQDKKKITLFFPEKLY